MKRFTQKFIGLLSLVFTMSFTTNAQEISGFNYIGSLNGSSYYVSDNTSSWYSNKLICENLGGHLAVITSEEENNFISQLIQQSYDDNLVFHIGFSDENSEGNWFWVNGEEFNYSNWSESEPSNSYGGEHYGQIYWSGYWNDIRNNNGADANRAILEIQYQSSNNDENTDIDTIELENVPNDYSTIQEAIDASSDGDTIMVSPGIYYENDIIFDGKKIVLLSSEGPENTIIDGSDNGRIFDITQGESFDTEINGFTIQNGNHSTGSAIRIINDSYLTVKNCIIQNNSAPGIWTRAAVTIGQEYNNATRTPAGAKFISTSFINNSGYYGAAVFNEESGEQSSEFIECIFDSNNGYGGAAIFGTRNSIIRNCIFIDNYTSGPSNAIIQNEGGNPEIINSVFYNNQSYVLGRNSSLPTHIINCVSKNNLGFINLSETDVNLIQVSYSNIEGGYEGEGNIDIDPLFVNAENDDFSLQEGSPCIDAGNPDSHLDPDSTIADMGAIYFHQNNLLDTIELDDINILTDSIVSLNELITSLQEDLSIAMSNQTQLIPIDLSEGWNIIGYTLYEAQDAVASFQAITDIIEIVKNSSADVYWPEFSFNGIGDLIPGQGYQIKVSEEYSGFTYLDTQGQRIELTPTVPQWAIDMEVEMHPNDIRTLLRVINMLGQEVNPETQLRGSVLLYLYNDATVEKKMVK